jgi:hypothetical protein
MAATHDLQLVLLAIFAPAIRREYLSARNKMRAVTERRRLKRKKVNESADAVLLKSSSSQ